MYPTTLNRLDTDRFRCAANQPPRQPGVYEVQLRDGSERTATFTPHCEPAIYEWSIPDVIGWRSVSGNWVAL